MFAVDLLLWFVSGFSLLMLACSTLFVIYFCIRTMLEILFSAFSPEPHIRATRPALRNVEPALAAVYKNGRTQQRGIVAVNAVATAGRGGRSIMTSTLKLLKKSSASWRSESACAIVQGIRVHTRPHRGSRLRSSKLSNSTRNDCEFRGHLPQVNATMCRPDRTRPL